MPSGRKRIPIRWDIVDEVRKFLRDLELIDAPIQTKMFYIFRNRTNISKGITFLELCVILHEDKITKDPKTEEIIPDHWGMMQTREDVRQFRKNMKYTSVILYCLTDKVTGASLLINITTAELFEIIIRRMDKIVKGIHHNKNQALKILGLNKKDRNKLSKHNANLLRRDHLDKLNKILSKERQKELAYLRKKFEQELAEKEIQDKQEYLKNQKKQQRKPNNDAVKKIVDDELWAKFLGEAKLKRQLNERKVKAKDEDKKQQDENNDEKKGSGGEQ